MPNFEDVRHLLDKFYPHGAKREIWWVTQESLDNNSCNQCGRCCAMFNIDFPLETYRDDSDKDTDTPNMDFLVEHTVEIPDAEARGGDGNGAIFVCCSLLTPDGQCSVYEDRPPICRRHPVLGQSVVKECAFAGTDDYEKCPRGIEDAMRIAELKHEIETKKVCLEKLRRNSEHKNPGEED